MAVRHADGLSNLRKGPNTVTKAEPGVHSGEDDATRARCERRSPTDHLY
jgi:hypothetical protein